MITNLHLKNFRAFQDFSLKGLNCITLIGGRNNSGKSAILESILLNFGMSNPQVFFALASLRNGAGPLAHTPQKIWTPLFFGYTQTNQFSIQMNRSNKEDSTLTIKKITDDTAYFNTNQDTLTGILNQGIDPQHIEDYFYALESSYQIGNQKSTGKYAFRKEGIQYISASTPNMFKGPLTKVLFFSSKTVPSNNLIAEWFSRLNLRGDKSQILNILKIFDPEIADIFTVIDSDSPSLYIQFTDHSHMPLSILGDGINKATQILLCILTTPNGIVLIDEIENGFHYSVYPKVLNAFYEAALKSNTQLIITTHNADILCTSADVMRSKNKLDHLAYERIDFSQNRRRAFSFTGEELYHALDAELEVR